MQYKTRHCFAKSCLINVWSVMFRQKELFHQYYNLSVISVVVLLVLLVWLYSWCLLWNSVEMLSFKFRIHLPIILQLNWVCNRSLLCFSRFKILNPSKTKKWRPLRAPKSLSSLESVFFFKFMSKKIKLYTYWIVIILLRQQV